MVTKFHVPLPLLVLTTLVIPLLLLNQHVTSAQKGKDNALIQNTCKHTYYPEDCIKDLKSALGGLYANLMALVEVSMQVAASKVEQTRDYVHKSLNSAPDYGTWAMLTYCPDRYENSVYIMKEGLYFFDEKKYKSAYQSVDMVCSSVTACTVYDLPVISQNNTVVLRSANNTLSLLHLVF